MLVASIKAHTDLSNAFTITITVVNNGVPTTTVLDLPQEDRALMFYETFTSFLSQYSSATYLRTITVLERSDYAIEISTAS